MNILVIISETPPIRSGVSRVYEEIGRRLRAAGHIIDTISTSDIPRLELGEVRLSSMPWKGITKVFPRIKGYDLVHIHGPVPTFSDVALFFAALVRACGGPPVVYTHHCEIEIPGKEIICRPYNAAHRVLARLADHVVVSTPSYADSFAHYMPKDRVSIIPWGVNLSDLVMSKPAGFNILFVGQMRPYKGLDVLLRAFQRLENASLTAIGSGHQAEHYHKLAQQLGLHNICFLSTASDDEVQRAYHDAHVLVLPSRTRAEAFGLVLLEGMASGCIPVASSLPGLVDVVGTIGETFPAGDDAALASILRQMQQDAHRMTERALAAHQWAERFPWDTAAHGYERLFSLLKRRQLDIAMDWFPQSTVAPRTAVSAPLPSNIQHSMHAIFERIAIDFEASRASLMLQTPGDAYLVISAHKGLDDTFLGQRVPLKESVAGWVASNGLPLYINSSSTPHEVMPFLRMPELSSALSIPMRYEEKVVGVLNLARHEADRAYTSDDLSYLLTTVEALKSQNTPVRALAAA